MDPRKALLIVDTDAGFTEDTLVSWEGLGEHLSKQNMEDATELVKQLEFTGNTAFVQSGLITIWTPFVGSFAVLKTRLEEFPLLVTEIVRFIASKTLVGSSGNTVGRATLIAVEQAAFTAFVPRVVSPSPDDNFHMTVFVVEAAEVAANKTVVMLEKTVLLLRDFAWCIPSRARFFRVPKEDVSWGYEQMDLGPGVREDVHERIYESIFTSSLSTFLADDELRHGENESTLLVLFSWDRDLQDLAAKVIVSALERTIGCRGHQTVPIFMEAAMWRLKHVLNADAWAYVLNNYRQHGLAGAVTKYINTRALQQDNLDTSLAARLAHLGLCDKMAERLVHLGPNRSAKTAALRCATSTLQPFQPDVVGDGIPNDAFEDLPCPHRTVRVHKLSAEQFLSGCSPRHRNRWGQFPTKYDELFKQDAGTVRFYHGTTLEAATSIVQEGVELEFLSHCSDFGRAFYVYIRADVCADHAIAAASCTLRYPYIVSAAVLVYDVPTMLLGSLTIASVTGQDWREIVAACRKDCSLKLPQRLRAIVDMTDVITGLMCCNARGVDSGNEPESVEVYQYAFKPRLDTLRELDKCLVGVLRFDYNVVQE